MTVVGDVTGQIGWMDRTPAGTTFSKRNLPPMCRFQGVPSGKDTIDSLSAATSYGTDTNE